MRPAQTTHLGKRQRVAHRSGRLLQVGLSRALLNCHRYCILNSRPEKSMIEPGGGGGTSLLTNESMFCLCIFWLLPQRFCLANVTERRNHLSNEEEIPGIEGVHSIKLPTGYALVSANSPESLRCFRPSHDGYVAYIKSGAGQVTEFGFELPNCVLSSARLISLCCQRMTRHTTYIDIE